MNISLDGIFRPKSIAVIGASTKKGAIGREILHNLIEGEFNGKVFPVNPKATVIHSIKCYSTILDVPDAVDLVIIVTPRDQVKSILEQCGEKGVKGAVVITAGFKEIGEEGAKKELELVEVIKKYNIRMVGPNCFGVLNTDPEYSMNATFSKVQPIPGTVGIMSQSGALGEAILDYANSLNLGFSMFVSVGNKADISGNDLLAYWEDDPNTHLILLYLENFGEPRTFTRIARSITRKKPVVAVKAGRTAAGAAAISSHTGVLAGLDVGAEALFEQCGVLRVGTVDELFDVAIAFTNQPLPKGDRIAVITNAGGPGILATDAVVSVGLKMAEFEKKTIAYLRKNLPPIASVKNPVDVIAAGGPESYRFAMDAVMSDKNVDAVIVIFVPPVVVDHRAVINAIVEMIEKHKNVKPVLGCFMSEADGIAGSEQLTERKIPIYTFPESAARAVWAMARYRKLLDRPAGKIIEYKVDKKKARGIIDKAIQKRNDHILGAEALEILDAYGIRIARSINVKAAKDLKEAARTLSFPVAMKIDDPSISHKTDVGGVVTDLRTQAEMEDAFKIMKKKFANKGKKFSGVIVQQMVRGGVETIIGMHDDPAFGPLMMFGLGGIYVEVMKDVSFKVHPLTDFDADEMIKSVKSYPLLIGFRGYPSVNVPVLQETILRLSQLVADFPVLKSFDVNPFIVTSEVNKSKAVDARFTIDSQ
ncbi:MAG: acetate--CoA ligase family protein [Candidatus Zixiibacteriota bacterium]|nr:MAG: acetate--CoA ligase family protein [candidate division Zixibacteria bacterium]